MKVAGLLRGPFSNAYNTQHNLSRKTNKHKNRIKTPYGSSSFLLVIVYPQAVPCNATYHPEKNYNDHDPLRQRTFEFAKVGVGWIERYHC